jgi:hypothetical protein
MKVYVQKLAGMFALSIFFIAPAGPAAAQKCEAGKLLAFGKHYDCAIAAQAKAVKQTGKILLPGEPECGDALATRWAKAEGFGDCPSVVSVGDALMTSAELTDALTETLAPGAPAPSTCSSRKLRGASKYAFCRLKVRRGSVLHAKPLDFTKCDAKLSSVFAKAEGVASPDCLTAGDLEVVRAQVTGDSDQIAALLAGATTTTTTTSTTTTTLGGLSDSFDGGSLDPSWTVLNPAVSTISVSGGQLHVQIDTLSNWFDSIESVLIYKDVTGDFDVRTIVYAAKTSNPLDEPDPQYRLGGLLARDPASTPATSNFVHVALGAGPFAVPFAAEDKTTTDSSSAFVFHPIVATEGELRLSRVGTDFSMYYRPVGDPTWQLLATHPRADLPATLQVGMMAYDFNASPDLTVSFDEIVFE